MGKFLQAEKAHQARFKASSPYFSRPARADGVYRQHAYPFCLPRSRASENLFAPLRRAALDYFAACGIHWHDGQRDQPSNHLCDSQVCCVNFLFPFAHRPQALAALLRPRFPTLESMLPVEDGLFVAFEWIGQDNYLKEKTPKNGKRSRGANFTSTDAIVHFRHSDDRQEVVLIEWKYTESYSPTPLHTSRSGTDRTAIYRGLYESPDCPLDKTRFPSYEDLFYEPFYQLMRQQFLAHEMEKAHELGADIVSLLHISPAANRDFMRVTSPGLRGIAPTATGTWGLLVRTPGRFNAISTEALFGNLNLEQFPDLRSWWVYVAARYPWVRKAGIG